MSCLDERNARIVSNIYSEPGVEWQLRFFGTHLHPVSEEATAALARRAAPYRFPAGGCFLELASARGDAHRRRRAFAPPVGVHVAREVAAVHGVDRRARVRGPVSGGPPPRSGRLKPRDPSPRPKTGGSRLSRPPWRCGTSTAAGTERG